MSAPVSIGIASASCISALRPGEECLEHLQSSWQQSVQVIALGNPRAGEGAVAGNASRSSTVTWEKWSESARAASNPAIPAPTTIACWQRGLFVVFGFNSSSLFVHFIARETAQGQ